MTQGPCTDALRDEPADSVLILRSNGDLEQADRPACLLFGADSLHALKARWLPFQAQIISRLHEAAEPEATVELSLASPGGASVAVGELHRLESDGWVLVVRSAPRAASIQDLEDAGSAQMVLHELSAGITHEWRDSLNSLTINRELLARTLPVAPAEPAEAAVQERCLRSLRHEGARMDVLIEALLGAVRRPVAHIGSTHLASILEHVQVLVTPAARHRHVTVSVAAAGIDTGVPPRDVRLALLCLAVDALHCLPGGGQLHIGVSVDGSMARLTVSAHPRAVNGRGADVTDASPTAEPASGPCMARTAEHIVGRHGGTLTRQHDATGITYSLSLPMTDHAARPRR